MVQNCYVKTTIIPVLCHKISFKRHKDLNVINISRTGLSHCCRKGGARPQGPSRTSRNARKRWGKWGRWSARITWCSGITGVCRIFKKTREVQSCCECYLTKPFAVQHQGLWGYRGERGSKGEKGDEVRII